MKKSLQSLVMLLMALMVPVTATAAYEQLADGVYQDGSTLYITSSVTSLGDLQVNPSEIYCYAMIPPACVSNTFTGYDATLHVPAAGMVSYFTTLYWYNFNNILSDAIEPLSVTMNSTEAEVEIGQQLSLSATVVPSDATPKTIYWSSTDTSVATVSSGGTVTAVAVGECDILATCIDKVAVCHVIVVPPRVTITLDKHEARLLPNHTITLTATCSPVDVDLAVTSSNPGVAIPRIVNGTIMVVGVAEGTATITVNAADGWSNPDSCVVTVYTEPGDVNCDGYVNISDVTTLIDYLLSSDPEGLSTGNADTNRDGNVNIADVTTLIDYLLSGEWPWERPITFTVNGVSFKMIPVTGGTFMMGATTEQGEEFDMNELPIHMVSLSDYSIGETEVTQALWQAVMGSNPSYITSANGYTDDPLRPVEKVSWYDCQLFISNLNELTGMNFRLPSEAEWEYAARGGEKSKGYKFAGSNTLEDVAWHNTQNGTHTVATKLANELNLYDMSGNVWEWCQDYYGSYCSEVQTNPIGPILGSTRVLRGGAWDFFYNTCRVSVRRDFYAPSSVNSNVGFRLALDKDNSSNFRLSETVIKILVGGSKSIGILNGNGIYTVNGVTENVTWTISDNQLTVTGTNEGTTTIQVTNNATGASTVLTVIVDDPNIETFRVNNVRFKMVTIEGGTFMMGASDNELDAWDGEKPAHQVTLSSFTIGQTEVTQELWLEVMGVNPSDCTNGLNCPVDNVSWNDCQTFITKLNEMTGKSFRLPTEAEWEYAARGGKKSHGYKYAGSNNINNVAWYTSNSNNATHPVGTKTPNELGLYDMTGNVWEWVYDWFGFYSNSAQTNPTGPIWGNCRVGRGGSWMYNASGCCVWSRLQGLESSATSELGLRLAQ